MVTRRTIALLALLAAAPLAAQSYEVADTITEYPNKGTFYHDKFHGRKTASGEVFDQNKFTAAHWKIKLGTMVMVTNRNNGRQVIVKVNDRCPKRGVFDLSHRAATAIGIRGMQPVNVRILPPGYEERWAAQEAMFDSVAVNTSRSATSAAPMPSTKPTPKPTEAAQSEGNYTLHLGLAANHSEAFGMTQRLPEAYRDKVIVEPTADADSLSLTLDLHLTAKSADELRRALLRSFPKATIVSAE